LNLFGFIFELIELFFLKKTQVKHFK